MWGRAKEKPKLTIVKAADRAEKLLAEMQIELASYSNEVPPVVPPHESGRS